MTIAQPDDPLQVKPHAATQKRVTTARRPPDEPPCTLKDLLVCVGLRALRDGDWRRIDSITTLIQQGGLSHE
jgi:hypothetical protein